MEWTLRTHFEKQKRFELDRVQMKREQVTERENRERKKHEERTHKLLNEKRRKESILCWCRIKMLEMASEMEPKLVNNLLK